MSARLVAISGGSCSGKTTLLAALAGCGFRTIPEAALAVIDELIAELGGVQEQIAWRTSHAQDFQERVVARQIELEQSATLAEGLVFLDRCQVDSIAYCRLRGLKTPPLLQLRELAGRYGSVFVLDTLNGFDQRAATGRTSDRQASLRVRDLLLAAYEELGYRPILVPELPPQERLALVLQQVFEAHQPPSNRFDRALLQLQDLVRVDQQHRSIFELLASAVEELGELSRELLIEERAFASAHKKGDEGTPAEAVDLTICALALYFARGGTVVQLPELIQHKLDKWQATSKPAN
jgi:predicted ATPase